MMVKLAILFAMLLLLTVVAFAADCDYYEISFTDLDGPPETWNECVEICFDGDNVGSIANLCGENDELYMFFDSMREQALTYHANDGVCVAYLKFHGSRNNVLTGLITGEGRATLWGHKVDESECIDE